MEVAIQAKRQLRVIPLIVATCGVLSVCTFRHDAWFLLGKSQVPGDVVMRSAAFDNECHGWAVAPTGLYETYDGGRTWANRCVRERTYADTVAIAGDRGIWIGGAEYVAGGRSKTRSVLMRTENQGKTWERVALDIGNAIEDLQWCGDQGWAIGEETVARSSDRGQSWTTALRIDGAAFRGGRCAGTDGLWVADTHGRIAVTQDKGQTWAFTTPEAGVVLMGLEALSPSDLAI